MNRITSTPGSFIARLDAAKVQAQQLVNGRVVELWQGGRQIAVLEPPPE
jgi:hypothetical protein